MKKTINLILLAIAVALGAWVWQDYRSERHDLSHLIKRDNTPEYTGEQVSTAVFDLNGKPQYEASAQEVKRYEDSERTEFFKPLLNLYGQGESLAQWKIRADFAELNNEKLLTLSGDVKVQALDKSNRLQLIETEQLTIDLTNQDIFTDKAVKSVGMGFVSEGVGLQGNLKQQVATLKQNVKTSLEPTVIQLKPREKTAEP